MKMKLAAFVVALMSMAAIARANGPDRATTVDANYLNTGKEWRCSTTTFNTSTVVLLSSRAINTELKIKAWRKRRVINTADGQLMLVPTNIGFTSFSSSMSMTLSSGSAAMVGQDGSTQDVTHQGNIWGVWALTTSVGGAMVCEEWQP